MKNKIDYKTLVSCFKKIKQILDKYERNSLIAGISCVGTNNTKLEKISYNWLYKGVFNYNQFIIEFQRYIIKLAEDDKTYNIVHTSDVNFPDISLRIDVVSVDDEFDKVMKLVKKDYDKLSADFKKYINIVTDKAHDGYSFDIDLVIPMIPVENNQNLFESFNSFADDSSLVGKQSFIQFYNRLKSKYKPANEKMLLQLKESIIDSYVVSDNSIDFRGKEFLKRLTKEELLVCFPDCYSNIKDLSLRIEDIPEFDEDDYIDDEGEFNEELYDLDSLGALYGSIEDNTFYLESKGSNRKVISTLNVDDLPDIVVKKLIKFLS